MLMLPSLVTWGYPHEEALQLPACLHVNHKRAYLAFGMAGRILDGIALSRGTNRPGVGLWTNEHWNMVLSFALFSRTSQPRTDLSRASTGGFAMNVWTNTGLAISFVRQKSLVSGVGSIMSVGLIHRWITWRQLNLSQAVETGNMTVNKPTLLTDGCT